MTDDRDPTAVDGAKTDPNAATTPPGTRHDPSEFLKDPKAPSAGTPRPGGPDATDPNTTAPDA